MRVAVATIAKNEEQFVARWAKSCADADYRLILDTGSTDNTVAIANERSVYVEWREFNPWRFDHARNHALSLIPDDIDYVIWLDMDEVLQPGWRQALEKATATRPRYKYVWSWNENGSEGLTYAGDKIHKRHGYIWQHPVHEVLKAVDITETQEFIEGLEIHHHPDHTKSRSQYLPLLELAVKEDPHDDRNQFYLAREYFFNGQYGLAQYHFGQHLHLSQWNPERAASHRYLAKMRPDAAEFHLYRAIAEDPTRRESWVELQKVYYQKQDWASCYYTGKMALRITEKPLDYLCEAEAWGWLPYDLLAIASFHLGKKNEAYAYGLEAFAQNPTDHRLEANLEWYL